MIIVSEHYFTTVFIHSIYQKKGAVNRAAYGDLFEVVDEVIVQFFSTDSL